MKQSIKRLVDQIPYVKRLKSFETYYPPGHFYSPIADTGYVLENKAHYFSGNKEMGDVEMNDAYQLDLFRTLAPLIADNPLTHEEATEGFRFYNKNGFYGNGDAMLFQAIIRHFKPKRIIEAGSGFSSALMMDINDRYFNNGINLTFIEPFPTVLNTLLTDADRKKGMHIHKGLQEVDTEIFRQLEANDILFIDSTHVARIGSDVLFLFFEILPKLKPGVLIHLHDIFNNFEYLEHHFTKKPGFGWNENYFLRAFLMNNNDYRIQVFPNYLDNKYQDKLMDMAPSWKPMTSGAFWMRKEK